MIVHILILSVTFVTIFASNWGEFPFGDSPIFAGTLVQNGRSKSRCRVLPADSPTQSLNFIHAIRSINETDPEGPKFNLLAVGIAGDGVVNTSTTFLRLSIGRGRREGASYGQYLFQESKFAVGVSTGVFDPNKLNGRTDDKVSNLIVRVSFPVHGFEDPVTKKVTNFTIGWHYIEMMVRDLKDPNERSCIRIENAFYVPPVPVYANISFPNGWVRSNPSPASPLQSYDTVTVNIADTPAYTNNANFTHLPESYLMMYQNISLEADLVRIEIHDYSGNGTSSSPNPEANELCGLGMTQRVPLTLYSQKIGRFIMPHCPEPGVWNLTIRFPDNIHVLRATIYSVERRSPPQVTNAIHRLFRLSPFGREYFQNQSATGLFYMFESVMAPNAPYKNFVEDLVFHEIDRVASDPAMQPIFQEIKEYYDEDETTEVLADLFQGLSFSFEYLSWQNFTFPVTSYASLHDFKRSVSSIPFLLEKQKEPNKHLHQPASTLSYDDQGIPVVNYNPPISPESIAFKEGKLRPSSFLHLSTEEITARTEKARNQFKETKKSSVRVMNNQEITNPEICSWRAFSDTHDALQAVFNQNEGLLSTLPAMKKMIPSFRWAHLTLPGNSEFSPAARKVYQALLIRYFMEILLFNINWQLVSFINSYALTNLFESNCYIYCYDDLVYRKIFDWYSEIVPQSIGTFETTCGSSISLERTIRKEIQIFSWFENSCYWSDSNSYSSMYYYAIYTRLYNSLLNSSEVIRSFYVNADGDNLMNSLWNQYGNLFFPNDRDASTRDYTYIPSNKINYIRPPDSSPAQFTFDAQNPEPPMFISSCSFADGSTTWTGNFTLLINYDESHYNFDRYFTAVLHG